MEVKLWKHLDPTQVSDLTLEPWFLRLTIKKKVFQLRFLEEVLCDRYSMKVQKSFSHISYRSTKSYIMNKALSWLFYTNLMLKDILSSFMPELPRWNHKHHAILTIFWLQRRGQKESGIGSSNGHCAQNESRAYQAGLERGWLKNRQR